MCVASWSKNVDELSFGRTIDISTLKIALLLNKKKTFRIEFSFFSVVFVHFYIFLTKPKGKWGWRNFSMTHFFLYAFIHFVCKPLLQKAKTKSKKRYKKMYMILMIIMLKIEYMSFDKHTRNWRIFMGKEQNRNIYIIISDEQKVCQSLYNIMWAVWENEKSLVEIYERQEQFKKVSNNKAAKETSANSNVIIIKPINSSSE